MLLLVLLPILSAGGSSRFLPLATLFLLISYWAHLAGFVSGSVRRSIDYSFMSIATHFRVQGAHLAQTRPAAGIAPARASQARPGAPGAAPGSQGPGAVRDVIAAAAVPAGCPAAAAFDAGGAAPASHAAAAAAVPASPAAAAGGAGAVPAVAAAAAAVPDFARAAAAGAGAAPAFAAAAAAVPDAMGHGDDYEFGGGGVEEEDAEDGGSEPEEEEEEEEEEDEERPRRRTRGARSRQAPRARSHTEHDEARDEEDGEMQEAMTKLWREFCKEYGDEELIVGKGDYVSVCPWGRHMLFWGISYQPLPAQSIVVGIRNMAEIPAGENNSKKVPSIPADCAAPLIVMRYSAEDVVEGNVEIPDETRKQILEFADDFYRSLRQYLIKGLVQDGMGKFDASAAAKLYIDENFHRGLRRWHVIGRIIKGLKKLAYETFADHQDARDAIRKGDGKLMLSVAVISKVGKRTRFPHKDDHNAESTDSEA